MVGGPFDGMSSAESIKNFNISSVLNQVVHIPWPLAGRNTGGPAVSGRFGSRR
jgi:hypothetical protein